MLVSYRWLQELVPIDVAPQELSEQLLLAGIENALKPAVNAVLKNVLCGRITDISDHPQADNLFICKVNTGDQEYPVITGAPNIEVGQIVPIAIPGATIAGGVKIEVTKVRGVESHGMVCSPDELGIGEINLPHELKEGILILPEDTPLGVEIQQVLQMDDVIFELELTTNRSDCLCMNGFAHEVATLFDLNLNLPIVQVAEEGKGKVDDYARLEVRDTGLCPRCTARVIENVQIEPSPFWLQDKLRSCGIRPINNIVDVTNYVMMEYGQPMHAYDLGTLKDQCLVVRRAVEGEEITTLDGELRILDPSILVISDSEKPIGLAGVMGGIDTEITTDTNTVILEAAAFNGLNIRKTYKRYNMRSEAAARFEKTIDTNQVSQAMNRAAQLIEDIGAGKVVSGMLDVHPEPRWPSQISMRIRRLNHLLGTHLSNQEAIDIVRRLGFVLKEALEEGLVVEVPTRRNNVNTESDLIEEIARVYGFNNVEATLPRGHTSQGSKPKSIQVEEKAKALLVSAGLQEVMTFSFMSRDMFDMIRLDKDDSKRNAISLQNPLSEDQAIMRTTMLPNLLEVMKYNAGRQIQDLQIFEIANVYIPKSLPLRDLPDERRTLCVAAGGLVAEGNWTTRPEIFDFYMLKGTLDLLFEKLELSGVWYKKAVSPTYHPGRYAEIWHGSEMIGEIGEVHSHVTKEFDLSQRIYGCELNFDYLAMYAQMTPQYIPLPKYPAVSRDLAIIVKEETEQQQAMEIITAIGGELLEKVTLFDVYQGNQVSPGYKSLGYSLIFRHSDKTLTDKDVDVVIQGIMAVLGQNLQAKLRE